MICVYQNWFVFQMMLHLAMENSDEDFEEDAETASIPMHKRSNN